jgi:hypothetical protein
MALLAVPAAAEYYDFIANPLANRLGQNAWCIIAIMQVPGWNWRIHGVLKVRTETSIVCRTS